MILSFYTCGGIQLLRSDILSCLLNLPGNIVMAGSNSWVRLLMTTKILTNNGLAVFYCIGGQGTKLKIEGKQLVLVLKISMNYEIAVLSETRYQYI